MAHHSDTDPTVQRIITAGYRRMSPARRLELAAEMCRAVEALSEAGVRLRHPDANADEIRLRVAARRLPRELMIRACGWDPVSQGY